MSSLRFKTSSRIPQPIQKSNYRISAERILQTAFYWYVKLILEKEGAHHEVESGKYGKNELNC